MKNEENKLLEFLGGLAMLVVGLFWFSTKVTVSSGFFNGTLTLGGFGVSSGVVIVPFIISIILLFMKPESFGRKLFMAFSVLLILFSIILTTKFRLATMTLFEWISILVLTFGGLALVCKTLFTGKK